VSIPACPDNRELGDRGEDVEKRPAYRSRRVDALLQDPESDVAVLQFDGELSEVPRGSTEPVKFGDDEYVAWVQVPERGVELWA